MIQISQKIIDAYKNSTTQADKIIIDNKEYRINNVQYSDDCYEEGNIFGTAIARTLEFDIENTIDLEKKEVEYLTGILVDGEMKWYSLGNFIIQDIEPNDTTNINKVTAMDYMIKSNTEYVTNLDYTSNKITILQVLQEVCKNSQLVLATIDFANNNFIVDSNQFTQGTLNRQVIQAIAQISGTFAKIKSDNKLYFITPKDISLTVGKVDQMTVSELDNLLVENVSTGDGEYDLNSYKELVLKRNTHPINLVSLGMTNIEGENITLRDESSIAEDGENSLVINDNPFAYTQEKREQLITALFDVVKGFEYTAYEISGQSKPYLETGDSVVVIDKDGNMYNSFLFRFNFKSPNGLESEMSAPSIIKATVAYQNIPSALDLAKRTEIIVNKQEGKITQLTQETTENSEKISKQEQTIEGIKDTLSSVETKVETVETKADNAQNTANANTTKIATTTEKLTEVEETVDGITQNVSKVEEKVETVEEKADNAQTTADNINNNLTTNYYTKTQTNSQIKQESDNITSSVSKSIATAKQDAIDSANSSTDDKLDNYSTTAEMNSKISQTAESINSEVSKKVGNDEIISKINQSAEEVRNRSIKNRINGSNSFKFNSRK